jgi:plastocyanin
MKKKLIFTATLLSIATIAAFSMAAFVPQTQPTETPQIAPILKYTATFSNLPDVIKANEPAELRFEFANEAGESVRFLEKVHEKPLHLMIVSDDLQEFYHVHPEMVTDYFSLEETFPHGGKYHLFADYTPPGGKNTIARFTVDVKGKTRPRANLSPDKELVKKLDGLQVTMSADREIKAGEDFLMTFSLADETTRQPVTDLQLYLASLAHIAVFSGDLSNFIHAHPLEAGEIYDPMKGAAFHSHNEADGEKKLVGPSPSEVKVPMIFPKAGLYKLWAQFKRNDRVIAVPFVVKVGESGKTAAESIPEPIPGDAIAVKVSKSGYEPARINLSAGKKVKLAFQRIDAENCGSKVVFKSLNIERNLPVGKTVIIEFTPDQTGEIGFACEMGMYKGILVVN